MMKYLYYIVLAISVFSCSREPIDPAEYLNPQEVGFNYIELKDESTMLKSEDKKLIKEVTPNSIIAQGGIFTDFQAGDIIVNTAMDKGDTLAYFRRVVEVIRSGEEIELRTQDVNLAEAYKRYYIDSRSKEFRISGRNLFQETLSFNRSENGFGATLAAYLDPMISTEFTLDTINSYFVSSYDEEAGTPNNLYGPARFELRVRNLSFGGNVSFSAFGKLEGKIESDFPYFPVAVLGPTGLTLYLQPKIELALAVEGTLTSPVYDFVAGPYDIDFVYENNQVVENNISETRRPAEALQTQWMATGQANLELKFGAELTVAITGTQEFARAGIFLFGYINPTIEKRGDFQDLSPRLGIDVSGGIGIQFFAEFNFFGGQTPPVNWIPDQQKFESPDDRYEFFNWNIANTPLCNPFTIAEVSYEPGQMILSIDRPGAFGYDVYINDDLISSETGFIPYGTSETFDLPVFTALVNKLEIVDQNGGGCSLTTSIIDPSLVQECDGAPMAVDEDGNEYCSVLVGDLYVMTENYRYDGPDGNLGVPYGGPTPDEELIYGRLYSYDEVLDGHDVATLGDLRVQGICPDGWHIPSGAEWAFIINTIGRPQFGLNAKMPSNLVWPNAQLPSTSMLNIVPAGEYYSWRPEGFKYGNRGKEAHIWSSTTVDDDAVFSLFVNESNTASTSIQSQAGESYESKSIKDLGYSCRCVKPVQ